jgi:hypothetical protein
MRTTALVGFALALATPGLAGPPGIQNARIESRSAAPGLAAVVKAETASRPGPAWIGWSVSAQSEGSSCCWSSDGPEGRCRECRLEGRDGFTGTTHEDEAEPLESSGRVRILLRVEAGRVGRIRAFSEDCPLDAGGLPLVWLEDVKPAESVAWLTTLAGRPKDGAVPMAIALHADPLSLAIRAKHKPVTLTSRFFSDLANAVELYSRVIQRVGRLMRNRLWRLAKRVDAKGQE